MNNLILLTVYLHKISRVASALVLATLLVACGSDSSSSTDNNTNNPSDTGDDVSNGGPSDDDSVEDDSVDDDSVDDDSDDNSSVSLQSPRNLTIKAGGIKTFQFEWTDSENATYYKLLQNIDGLSGFEVIRDNIPQGEQTVSIETALHTEQFSQYTLQACNEQVCSGTSNVVFVQDHTEDLLNTVGFFKASNAGKFDRFGGLFVDENNDACNFFHGPAMSLSADGQTLVVGAPGEDSATRTINGPQLNEDRQNSGAVYVFTKTLIGWEQQAYIKAKNAEAGDFFGVSVSVSADGNTLAVGAIGEGSKVNGVNPVEDLPLTNDKPNSGAVYVFTRNAEQQWSQHSFIKASNSGFQDAFGNSVAISGDGSRLIVGAPNEDSNSNGGFSSTSNANDNADDTGAVYVFNLVGNVWREEGFLKANNPSNDDRFGSYVRISDDGSTIGMGVQNERSGSQLINEGQGDDRDPGTGAVYIFVLFENNNWFQQAYIKASNSDKFDCFGASIDLDERGDTLVVGARGEDSRTENESNDDGDSNGAAYVFERINSDWFQKAYLKASNNNDRDFFGKAVRISADGNTIAVSADGEASKGKFFSALENNNERDFSGAVYVYERIGTDSWPQKNFVKSTFPRSFIKFGEALGLSSDGSTLAVGTGSDNTNVTGINGDQSIVGPGGEESGAVFLY